MKSHLQIFYLLILTLIPIQKALSQNKIVEGEMLRERVRLLDTSHQLVTLNIPSDTCLLFYRFRGKSWLTETHDSILKVEQIVDQLLATSRYFSHLKVICYSYNADNFLTSLNKPVFKNSEKYSVEYYFISDKNSNKILQSEKLILINKRGKVLASSVQVDNFAYTHVPETKKLKAKILTEKNGTRTPIANAYVYLFSKTVRDTMSMARTDKYGDFELNFPENEEEHTLRVEPAEKNIKLVILASQEGVEKFRIDNDINVFEYKFIPADVNRLFDMEVDDNIAMAFRSFITNKDLEYRKSENIIYKTGSYSIEENSKKSLDIIANLLEENPSIQLEVISHTDAQGDDKSNMQLSEKRSLSVVSYLILIGVHQGRLSYKGKGETEIRNRCKNGVDCSDIEHGYNRRTEFRFHKAQSVVKE